MNVEGRFFFEQSMQNQVISDSEIFVCFLSRLLQEIWIYLLQRSLRSHQNSTIKVRSKVSNSKRSSIIVCVLIRQLYFNGLFFRTRNLAKKLRFELNIEKEKWKKGGM